MDARSSLPGSPTGGPLQAVTPDRVNQRRESAFTPMRFDGRESPVHEKISQFNNLSVTMQSKQLERKTADAALKRAMLGREEAEAEMRRLKDEAKALRSALDEGKERERRVGERLETVMENHGRAKETHAHTQALWEKEIRRARKENFKTQSSIVKLQEELKSARSSTKMMEESIEREKERSRVREQEAFTARYQIVGVQEQLEKAMERIKLVEQERDAFKTVAKNEEVARIAAEGRIPLPPAEQADDEFASPKKKPKAKAMRHVSNKDAPRVSLSTMDILSSAASEQEIDELSNQVMWERQRANRAQEMIEFLQAECQMHCCPCSKSDHHTKPAASSHEHAETLDSPMTDEISESEAHGSEAEEANTPSSPPAPLEVEQPLPQLETQLAVPKSKKCPRRSTIFCPREGIFRTVSEQEAADFEAKQDAEVTAKVHVERDAEPSPSVEVERNPRMYARTPSVDPPAFALLVQERTSLQSLLNAPHGNAHSAPTSSIRNIPTVADDESAVADEEVEASPLPRASTSAASYTVTTTTTVPVRDENFRAGSSFGEKLRTPSGGSNASFDLTNPALTPTMTREQALAKIRERRGRARSVAQGTVASQKKIKSALDRRDVSAPTAKAGGKPRRS